MTTLTLIELRNYVTELPDGVVVTTAADYSGFGDTRALAALQYRNLPTGVDPLAYEQALRDLETQLAQQRLDWSCGQAIELSMEGQTVYEPADVYAKVNASWAIAKCQALGISIATN